MLKDSTSWTVMKSNVDNKMEQTKDDEKLIVLFLVNFQVLNWK